MIANNRTKGGRPFGFTMVELIIYLSIIGIFLVSAISLSLQVLSGNEKERSFLEVNQNARFALDKIVQEIRIAGDLNAGSSTFNTSPGVLSLANATPALNPTIFDVSGGRLRVTQGVGSPIFLTSSRVNVSNLVFKNLSVTGRTKVISIQLTLNHLNPSNDSIYEATYTIEGSAVLRSKEN